MTPKEYIATLQARHARIDVTPENLPDPAREMAKQMGLSLADTARLVNESDYGDYLLDLLRPRLPAAISSLFDDGLLAVGGLHDPTPNAYVTHVDDTGYAIVLHTGMRDLLYRVMRIIATHAHSRSNGAVPRSSPELYETARLLAEVFWWLGETEPPRVFGPEYAITTDQIKVAGLLAIESGLFLLAHEIGHVILDGSDGELEAKIGTVRGCAHEDEHSADIFALHLTLGFGATESEMRIERLMYAYAGAELVLQVYHALEQFPGLVGKSTHPPAAERLERLRSFMQKKCECAETWATLSSVARALEAVLTKALEIIQDPGEHAQFFSQQAELVARDFHALLDRCSDDDLVPDYATFYEEASRLFGRGYSHKLSEHVAEIVMAYLHPTRIATDRHEANVFDDPGYRRVFRKFKLLYGFIDGLPDPARTIFGRAFSRGTSQ